MKDQVISFETAKILKGVDFPTVRSVYLEEKVSKRVVKFKSHWKKEEWVANGDLEEDENAYNEYPAPTQSLVQKWLREKYNIDITIMIRFAESYGVLLHQNRNPIRNKNGDILEIIVDPSPSNIKTGIYEEALEKGLQEALKLINT